MPPKKGLKKNTKTCKNPDFAKIEIIDSISDPESDEIIAKFKRNMKAALSKDDVSQPPQPSPEEEESTLEEEKPKPKAEESPQKENPPTDEPSVKVIDFLREKRDNFCNYLLKMNKNPKEAENIKKLQAIPIELFYIFIKQRLYPSKHELDKLINSFIKENSIELPKEGDLKDQVLNLTKRYLQCFIDAVE